MAVMSTTINLSEVDRTADQPFELLPDGDFLLEVIASDPKVEGNNVSHSYTYSVIEPEELKGRRIYDWINLRNDTEWMQKKGQARWGNLCDSIGYDEAEEGIITDDEVLFFRPFMAKVLREAGGVSKAGKAFKPSNKVERFYKTTDKDAPEGAAIYPNQPPLAVAAAAPVAANNNARPATPAPASRPAGTKPWGKKAA